MNWRICYPRSNSYRDYKRYNKRGSNAQRLELSRFAEKRYEVWKCSADKEKISVGHKNQLGAYSYRKFPDKSCQPGKLSKPGKKMLPMWYMRFTAGHMKQCKAINAKC